MNVTPELASPLGRRSVAEVARSAVVSSLADAILVSGPMQGVEPSVDSVREAKEAVAEPCAAPQHGAKSTNVREYSPRSRTG